MIATSYSRSSKITAIAGLENNRCTSAREDSGFLEGISKRKKELIDNLMCQTRLKGVLEFFQKVLV